MNVSQETPNYLRFQFTSATFKSQKFEIFIHEFVHINLRFLLQTLQIICIGTPNVSILRKIMSSLTVPIVFGI